MKKRKIFKKMLIVLLSAAILSVIAFFYVGKIPAARVSWGVNFSPEYARELGLDWRETFRVILKELGAQEIRVSIRWNSVEPERGKFSFQDLDWMVSQAAGNGAHLIVATGMKAPRWPECHVPSWAVPLPREDFNKAATAYIETVVRKYKEAPAITAWQIENEPFVPFGDCRKMTAAEVGAELAAVRNIDPSRPVFTTDSGEWSSWLSAAEFSNPLGITMYRRVWFAPLKFYLTYPFSPLYYRRKAEIVKKLFGTEVIDVELQAEAWGRDPIQSLTADAINKTMSHEHFEEIIRFAPRSGISRHYFWGAEWWHFMKKNGDSWYFDRAKKLFAES